MILLSKKSISLAPLLTITQVADICGVKKGPYRIAEKWAVEGP